jgi:Icc protein
MIKSIETISKEKIKDSGIIKIIQITDTHILDDNAPSFNDFDTSESLKRVLEAIRKNEADADLILLTGDLVHEATETAYQKLVDHLATTTIPILALPGNHDIPERMHYVMGANGHDMGNLIKFDNWLVILLNTCIKGEHSGELSVAELEFLKSTLQSNTDKHCLIALHHHPVSINSSWMDAMSLKNAESFFDVIDEFNQVRAIIWGHIHQEFESEREGVSLFGTPSTCLQFKPGSNDFEIDKKKPAYRRLKLKNDGKLSSKVVYLKK